MKKGTEQKRSIEKQLDADYAENIEKRRLLTTKNTKVRKRHKGAKAQSREEIQKDYQPQRFEEHPPQVAIWGVRKTGFGSDTGMTGYNI